MLYKIVEIFADFFFAEHPMEVQRMRAAGLRSILHAFKNFSKSWIFMHLQSYVNVKKRRIFWAFCGKMLNLQILPMEQSFLYKGRSQADSELVAQWIEGKTAILFLIRVDKGIDDSAGKAFSARNKAQFYTFGLNLWILP